MLTNHCYTAQHSVCASMALLPGRPKSFETYACWQLINFRNPNSKLIPELNNAALLYIHSEAVDFEDHLLHFETSLTSDGSFGRKCDARQFCSEPPPRERIFLSAGVAFRFVFAVNWRKIYKHIALRLVSSALFVIVGLRC